MDRDESVLQGAGWHLPAQREAAAEAPAEDELAAGLEPDVISFGPVANPNRLRLGASGTA